MKKCLILLLTITLVACQGPNQGTEQQAQQEGKAGGGQTHKNVVFIILDSFSSELMDRALKQDKAPALRYLKEHGQYYKNMVTPFPSMSVSVESSLVTGKHPHEHGVRGLSWYLPQEARMVNYGSSFYSLIAKGGIDGAREGINDALFHLNQTHLSKDTPTIFETLEEQQVRTGAINMLIYRGHHSHQLSLPYGIENILNLPDKWEVKAPEVFTLGRFSKSKDIQQVKENDHLLAKLGLNDEYAVKAFVSLVKHDKQPDLTMLFLPDFDHLEHEEGPENVDRFLAVEQGIQDILNAYDSWEKALDENIFIVLGDHGQVKVQDEEAEAEIDLHQMFHQYQVSPLEDPDQGDVTLGVNQRMSYVYDVHQQGLLPRLAQEASQDKRVDIVAWQEQDWIQVRSPETDAQFRFKANGEWEDEYGQSWTIEGNPEAADLQLDTHNKHITFGDYPDALQHIYSALQNQPVPTLILSAKPGHSFYAEGIPTHPGGADHGGLHEQDISSAMIVAGTDQSLEQPRVVDLKQYIISLLTDKKVKRDGVQNQSHNEKNKKQLAKNGKQKQHKKANVARETKRYMLSIDGVQDCVVVAMDEDIYIALQPQQFHRFRLPEMRKEAHHLARSTHEKYRVHVSTDWKVYRELEKLKQRYQQMKADDLRKKLDKIEDSMRG
ncbi:alkaline phosphatase family protein [Caldalkalibacillus salinus]|uniref:alkaline phosphatase family protein n=1 Tax=Caldalkalibacillus salinus TaxID=2803787 RepID=UPI001922346F|nr:alkaline phosphatase family protein [Caldalkalibacillus salinus]